jgi:PAS domain S-box-containing protein
MEASLENDADEVKRLRGCINDLVSILALPAMWAGDEPSRVGRALLDVLPGMLHLDLIYLRLTDGAGTASIEMAQGASRRPLSLEPRELGALLLQSLGDNPRHWPLAARKRVEELDLSIVPMRLGLDGEIGVMVAGSRRRNFPGEIERLILNVAANQAAIGLQESRLLSEQKRVALELDRRVAQRTSELASVNVELNEKIAEQGLTDARLRKEETELMASEARKSAILQSALDCIVTIDHEGRITEFNPAAERTFGCRRDHVMGRALADVIVPPSLREQHRRGFARYLATGEAHVLGKRLEMSAVRADGSEFPVELAITRIPLDGPPSFTGYLRDITERRQAEEKLRRSEAYLAEAQRLSLTGSFGWRMATDEHLWSAETFRIFDYHPSTRITLPLILERIHPQDQALTHEAIAQAAEGKDIEYECRLMMPAGEMKHVHIVAHATNYGSGEREYVGAVMDITATRHAEAALRQAQAELTHVSRVATMGELTTSIAHEVNQPLGSIINNANACLNLLRDGTSQLAEVREALAEIIQGADQASAVISRVRQLVRKTPAEWVVLDLRDVVADVLALSRHDAAARQVVIQTELGEDLPPVKGDRVQLQQVLLNLIANGMDAMATVDASQRALMICGSLETRDGEGSALVHVRDAGTGIKPEAIHQLFEAFYTTKPQGMGMGLAISRTIIETHGGRLWAEMNQGPGATFLFSLPAV